MNNKDETVNFNLTKEDIAKIQIWKENLHKIQEDVHGKDFQFEYSFYPTGLGIIKKVRRVDGKEIDITDYSKW